MDARTNELLTHLEASRRALSEAWEAIPSVRRKEAGPGGGWSAANVVAHLARTEGQVAALLQRLLRRALADDSLGPAPEGSVLATMDAGALLDRARRVEAPDFARPDPSLGPEEAWAELERARSRTRQVLLAGAGRDTRGLRQAHHALGELTFEQWGAFVGYHELRHAAQVRELAGQLAGDG